MTERTIPLARPNITQAEIDAVSEVLRTPNLSLGPKLPEFEQAFASYCGTRYAAACSSGTAALHLLLEAMGVGAGDEVITTPFSFIATANCALMVGAKPVFVDVDPRTWNIDPAQIEPAVTSQTKVIIPVDVFGTTAEMDTIEEIADRHGLKVIEDSCEALSSTYQGKPAGSFGDAGVFGFYPNKQITTGEGGMIVTDDEALADRCRSLRNQGRDGQGGWLAHQRMGYNFRLSDIACALGLAQLARIEEIRTARNQVVTWYRRRLAEEARVVLQQVPEGVDPCWFVFVVRLSDAYGVEQRDRILTGLRERGVECSNYFVPIHLQPFYVERFGFKTGDFPVCEALASNTVALPLHHELTEQDVDYVCQNLKELLTI